MLQRLRIDHRLIVDRLEFEKNSANLHTTKKYSLKFFISPLLTDISFCLQRDCSISFESDGPRWCRNEEKTPTETPEVLISGNYPYHTNHEASNA